MHKYLILLLLPVLVGVLCACRQDVPLETMPAPTQSTSGETAADSIPEEGQLIGYAETQEEAEQIAALYGITLVRRNHTMAVYYTDEDPEDVIRRGKANGWPELTLNRQMQPF